MKKIFWLIASVMIIGCAGGNNLNNSSVSDDKTIDISQLPKEIERIDSIAVEYWDVINIDDPEIERKLAEFYFILDLGSTDPEVMAKAFDKLILQTKKYPNLKDSINSLVKEYLYSTESPFLEEDWYEIFINESLKYGEVSEAQRIRYKETLEQIHRNRPGTKLPEISLLTDDGLKTISEIAGDRPAIILIYDNSCDDCQDAINRITKDETLPKMMEDGRIVVVGIDLGAPTSDTIKMAGWVNARAKSDIDSEISLRSIPSAYLIDPEGTILIKDQNVGYILDAIGFK